MIIPDMDLSYALASTLVKWDQHKQIVSGLAKSWSFVSENVIRFELQDGLKWSNGEQVKASEIILSLERGFKAYPEDHRSLKQLISKMSSDATGALLITTNIPVKTSGLLGKLTEPNYGALKVKNDGSIDLSISIGAFFLTTQNQNELRLKKNPHFQSGELSSIADEVWIKKSLPGQDSQTVLFNDSWPNVSETSSLISAELMSKYQKDSFQIWKRPLDKVFLIRLSPKLQNAEGYQLLRYLDVKLNRSAVLAGIEGAKETHQLFPKSYHLHDEHFPASNKNESIPSSVKARSLKVMYSSARVPKQLAANFSKSIAEATGHPIESVEIDISQYIQKLKEADYDIYLGTMGLADPDPEGVMSFYLENDPPVIPKNDGKLIKRLDEARKYQDQSKKLIAFRSILTDAVKEGLLLPLFHLSTVGLARPEIDLSHIPSSEESMTLSKIRFKGK